MATGTALHKAESRGLPPSLPWRREIYRPDPDATLRHDLAFIVTEARWPFSAIRNLPFLEYRSLPTIYNAAANFASILDASASKNSAASAAEAANDLVQKTNPEPAESLVVRRSRSDPEIKLRDPRDLHRGGTEAENSTPPRFV